MLNGSKGCQNGVGEPGGGPWGHALVSVDHSQAQTLKRDRITWSNIGMVSVKDDPCLNTHQCHGIPSPPPYTSMVEILL